MENYKNHYKNLDTQKIVSILRNTSEYNSDAIMAAKEELDKRNLSEIDLQKINEPLDNQVREIEERKEKIVQIKKGTKDKISRAYEIANPQLSSPDSIKIKSFSALLIANGIFALISQWSFLKFAFTNEMSNGIGIFEILQIVLITFPIIAGIMFLRKLKIGYYPAFSISVIGILAYILILASLLLNDYVTFEEKIPNAIFSISIISVLAYAIKFLLKENIREHYLEETEKINN